MRSRPSARLSLSLWRPIHPAAMWRPCPRAAAAGAFSSIICAMAAAPRRLPPIRPGRVLARRSLFRSTGVNYPISPAPIGLLWRRLNIVSPICSTIPGRKSLPSSRSFPGEPQMMRSSTIASGGPLTRAAVWLPRQSPKARGAWAFSDFFCCATSIRHTKLARCHLVPARYKRQAGGARKPQPAGT